jgi:membrane protein DedA with SNARE-associated domain
MSDMNELSPFLADNAGLAIFATIFAEQIGVPLPAAPVLVAAGALAADGALNPALALGFSFGGCILADLIWYYVGVRGGNKLVRLLCRLSLGDDLQLYRAQRLFAKYGISAIASAKFVPGLSFLMPALSGAFRIGTGRFLRFDALGSLLYGVAYLGLGFLFKEQVNHVLELLSRFGIGILPLMLAPVLLFAGFKYFRRRKTENPAVESHAGDLVVTTGS